MRNLTLVYTYANSIVEVTLRTDIDDGDAIDQMATVLHPHLTYLYFRDSE